MRIYQGNLNYSKYAIEENLVLVFPCGLSLKDPVCSFWKWTKDSKGVENRPNSTITPIDSTADTPEGYQIEFHNFSHYYHFTAKITEPLSGAHGYMTLNMRSKEGAEAKQATLRLQYSDDNLSPRAQIFSGQMNHFEYVRNEMVTLVFPRGIHPKEHAYVYFQWTEKESGGKKIGEAINAVNTEFDYVDKKDIDKGFKSVFKATDYSFTVTLTHDGKFQLTMEDNKNKAIDKSASHELTQRDQRTLRKKKVCSTAHV